MQQVFQRQRVQAHAEVARDAHQDQLRGGVFLRELRKHQRSAKGHHLRRQQEDHLPHGVEVQVGADVDAVVDDRAHAVDVEKKRDQEEQHLFVVQRDVAKCAEDFAERRAHRCALAGGML